MYVHSLLPYGVEWLGWHISRLSQKRNTDYNYWSSLYTSQISYMYLVLTFTLDASVGLSSSKGV